MQPCAAASGCRKVEFRVRRRDGQGGAGRILPGQAGAGGGSRGSVLAEEPGGTPGAVRAVHPRQRQDQPGDAGLALGWGGTPPPSSSSSSAQGRPALPVSSGSGQLGSSSGFGGPEPRPRGCENPPLVPPPRLPPPSPPPPPPAFMTLCLSPQPRTPLPSSPRRCRPLLWATDSIFSLPLAFLGQIRLIVTKCWLSLEKQLNSFDYI